MSRALQRERRRRQRRGADAPPRHASLPVALIWNTAGQPAARRRQHRQRLVVALEADVRHAERDPAAARRQHDVAAVQALVRRSALGAIETRNVAFPRAGTVTLDDREARRVVARR